MRLIDADELKKNEPNYHEGFRVFTEKEIDNAPTVELDNEFKKKAETYKAAYQIMSDAFESEVRKNHRPQGEWKLHGMIYYCSVCGHDYEQGGNNFCGHCGAKMRGGET